MSIKTWKEEFYPVTAGEIAKRTKNPLVLIDHSIRKWEGVTKGNRERHEVRYCSHLINSIDGALDLDDRSCSLCRAYRDQTVSDECAKCPVMIHTGSECFRVFVRSADDPTEMLKLLHEVRAKETAK